eukprot:scaffold74615_cov16-Tisochrysis_lutea.AAC.2
MQGYPTRAWGLAGTCLGMLFCILAFFMMQGLVKCSSPLAIAKSVLSIMLFGSAPQGSLHLKVGKDLSRAKLLFLSAVFPRCMSSPRFRTKGAGNGLYKEWKPTIGLGALNERLAFTSYKCTTHTCMHTCILARKPPTTWKRPLEAVIVQLESQLATASADLLLWKQAPQ